MVNVPGQKPDFTKTKGDLKWAVTLVSIWIGGGIFLWMATFVAGGHPTLAFWEWPMGMSRTFLGTDHLNLVPWHWVGSAQVRSQALFFGAFWGCGIFILALGFVYYYIRNGGLPGFFPNLKLQEYSWLARGRDLQKLSVAAETPGRIVLGYRGRNMIATEPGASVLLFGPTGSGKSSGFAVPSLLSWKGPTVAISVKRDLIDATAGYRQTMGEVHIFDPTNFIKDMDFDDKTTWSPLYGSANNFERCWKVADWMCGGADPKSNGGSDAADWAHWLDAARRVLATGLYTGATLGENINQVRSWIDDTSGKKLNYFFSQIENVDPVAVDVWTSIAERPEKERQTCFGTTQRMLNVFIEAEVSRACSTSNFRPDEFLKGMNTLYLVAPPDDSDRLAAIFCGVIMNVVSTGIEMAQSTKKQALELPLLLVLDECANTSPIRQLPRYMATGRAMGMTFMPIFQDMAQVKERYPDTGGTICNNARAKVFLPGISDIETLEFAHKLVGETEYNDVSVSQSGDVTRRKARRSILPPDVLRQLHEGNALLIYYDRPPAMLSMRQYFRDQRLNRLASMPFAPGALQVSDDQSWLMRPSRPRSSAGGDHGFLGRVIGDETDS